MLQKYFLKRLRNFALVMLIPLMLVFLIMGYEVIEAQQNDFKKIGDNTLNNINDNVINVIYSSINQQDVAMRNAQYMISMKKLMSHEILEYRDVIFMNAVINYLTSAETSYRYIDSIYLYMDGRNNFLASSSDELVSLLTFYDTEWYDHYRKIPKESTYYVENRSLQRYSYDKIKDVITIYQRMSYAKGVIILNVKLDIFGTKLNEMLDPSQNLFYVNKEGKVLYQSNKNINFNSSIENSFFSDLVEEYVHSGDFTNNQKWIKLNKEYYLVDVKPDDYNETYMISMISFRTFIRKNIDFIYLAINVLLITLLIVMLLAWVTTRSAFKHITYLVDVFSAAERGEPIGEPQPVLKDEYNLILNNILFLFIKNNQMQASLIEKQHQNEISELMALQLQINPHFIFNTLQTMDLEVLKEMGGQSTLHILIQELSKIIKYALTEPMELVSLKEELNYLKAYIEIQEVRFHNNIVSYYEIEDSLLEIPVFRLMLQPIIENSIIHGIQSSEKRCCIKIKISKRNNDICFVVIDNGCGMSKSSIEELRNKINNPKSKNIGLTNINRRLILHYGENSRLHILSKVGMGTVVRFIIPMDKLQS